MDGMSDATGPQCLTAAWLSDTGPALDCAEILTPEGIELLIYGPDGRIADTSFIPFELLDEDDQARVRTAVACGPETPSAAPAPRGPAGMDRVPLPRLPRRPVRA
ncbi:hypothetical protein CVT30_26795 [Streptomyces sp. AMCC400023]|nr:hypothetical protein CVT30_26795 [Streptomyces sp. AMCC400023]